MRDRPPLGDFLDVSAPHAVFRRRSNQIFPGLWRECRSFEISCCQFERLEGRGIERIPTSSDLVYLNNLED
jgi:hypothetical protein